jgi:tetratricopeptide (TPR) repeat protein
VAVALQIELQTAATEQIARPPTSDPEAYDLYLRGRYLLNKRTAEAIEKARQLFAEAVKKDPRFALGHAAIADSYILLGEYGQLSVSDAASRAWPEVSAALEINEQLAEGYLARAILLADFQWKWDAAEKNFRQAIQLNPNSATAHHWFALQLAQQGRTEEALKEIAIAEKHDPLSPIIRAAKAKILVMGRRFADAITQCRKALELEPNFAPAYSVLAQAFAFQRQFPEAIEAAKKYVDLSGGGDQERLELAYADALAGKKTEAQQVMTEVQRRGQNFSPYDVAAICIALENRDAALEWIEKAFSQHAIDVEWIGVDPRMDSIRSDARFRRLLELVYPPPESS